MGTFSRSLTAFASKVNIKANEAVKKITYTVYKECVERSPIDTERFRKSWRIGVGRRDRSTSPDTAGVKSNNTVGMPITATEVGYALATLVPARADQILYISNSVRYASFIELGSSQQAPSGVARVAMAAAMATILSAKSI